MTNALLELRAINKKYVGVVALCDVSIEVHAGEVVGLIGENGAGKSTMMKIIGGVTAPTTGTICFNGREYSGLTVSQAMQFGIAFVHQELNLFENLDVGANVSIGREPLKGGWLRLIDKKQTREIAAPLLRRLGVDFGPDAVVSTLSIAQRQMVEIAKALAINAKLIIMDEPTSSLTLSETDRLLAVISDLKASGVSVVYISHRLAEVKACADRVVCLRDGQVAGVLSKNEINHAAMVTLMIGRDIKSLYRSPKELLSVDRCKIQGLRTRAFPRQAINITVMRGEILGVAGLVGSGRTSLARALFGIEPSLQGQVFIDGELVSAGSPVDAIKNGIFLVPEDRKQSGLVLGMTVRDNVTLPNLNAYRKLRLIDPKAEEKAALQQTQELSVKTPTTSTRVGLLSGGNQQKVVLGKWLAMKPRLLILDEPTRGIDIGAKDEIYAIMRTLSDTGVSILMISSEMEEVIAVSDRIVVMYEGCVSGTLERHQFSEKNVLTLAIGQPIVECKAPMSMQSVPTAI